MDYDTIKYYYQLGLFTDDDLELFVTAGYIAEEQRAEIIAGGIFLKSEETK